MNILEFISNYPDEHSCRMDFKEKREHSGLCCSKCGGTRLNWLQSKYQWHCYDCRFRMTLRSGTVMHDSKLPVRTWYLCSALMTMTKKPISASEMQRKLGMKRYEPVWAMMHKIRKAMGQRDDRYRLEGIVEFDEGHFNLPKKKGLKLKRGLGSQRKRNVAVMAESTPLEDPASAKKSSQCRFYKLKVLEGQKADDINECIQESIDEKTIVITDKTIRYVDIHRHVEGHVTIYSDKESTNTTLKWVHIAISNAKRVILGVYHCIKGKNLQLYLNEFCYKLNRRYFGEGLFDRLLVALSSSRCKQTE